jgi:hypothetical protein
VSDYAVYCVRSHRFVGFATDRAAAETALTAYDPDYGPNLVVLPSVEAYACQRAAHRSAVTEITAERFQDMLEVLPPLGWHHDGRAESFKCPEEIVAGIVDIFVRMEEGRCFTFADDITLPHGACCARVRDSSAFRASPAPHTVVER